MAYQTMVEIDESLLNQAKIYANTDDPKDVLSVALSYYVSHISVSPPAVPSSKKKDIFDLAGKVRFADGYDYKAARGSCREFEFTFENLDHMEKFAKGGKRNAE